MPISRNVHCAKPFPRAELAHYRSGGVIYHSERCGMDEQGPRDAQHWTLYGALRRLLDQGWIERFTEDESPRDRRAYRLTPQGLRNLQLEVQRMRHLAKLATARVARREA